MNAKLCDLCGNVVVHHVPESPVILDAHRQQVLQHGKHYGIRASVVWAFDGDICRSCFFEIVKESLASELKQP